MNGANVGGCSFGGNFPKNGMKTREREREREREARGIRNMEGWSQTEKFNPPTV